MAEHLRTRTGQDARTTILATAVSLFRRVGLEQATLTAIAAELHVTKAAVYHHFKSKDDLVSAALAPLVTAVNTLLAESAAGSVPRDHLSDKVIDIALDHRELVLLCHPGALAGLGPEIAGTLENIIGRLLDCLAIAADPPSPVRARALIGSLSAVLAADVNHEVPQADLAEFRELARALVTQR